MNGILTDIGQAYASATAPWFQSLFPIAQRLFLLLATLELTWSAIWWAMASRQEETVLVQLLRKVLVLMFFYTVLLFAPSWIPAIVGSFVEAGQVTSGFHSLDPSAVLGQGIDVSVAMLSHITGIVSFLKMASWIWVAVVTVVISFAVIAGILLVTLIESYVVIGGGVLLLGFAGSRWTASFAEGYLLYAVRVGVKLFVIYLLIGIGMSLPETWVMTLEQVTFSRPGTLFRVFFEVAGGALIFAMIIWRVPNFAASMLGPRAGFNLERAYSD